MKRGYLTMIIIFAIVFVDNLFANTIHLEGHEPEYAGSKIVFQKQTDPISGSTDTTFILKIGPQGRILTDINIQEPLYCFAEFDIYLLKLMLVPGDSLRIKLPPRKPKSFEESKNPYFKPVETWVLSQSKNYSHLNSLFARFDQKYYNLNDKYFNQLYYTRQEKYLDSVVFHLEKEFGSEKNLVFIAHKKLMLKSIETGIMREGREKLMSDFESLTYSAWLLPSFSDLLERLFSQTWSTESKRPQGRELKSLVAGRKISELRNWTVHFTGINKPLTDLILLKLLHDAYYSGEFQKSAILDMLQSDLFMTNKVGLVIRTAKEIHKKLSFLLPGTPAPEICLPLIGNGIYCSKESKKSMQYILFADLEIPVCQEHVKYLPTLHDKIGDYVDILLILRPSSKMNQAEFIKQYNIPGNVVLDTQDDIFSRKFKIRAFPSAFLVDRNHSVVLSPARTPLDGFEFQIESIKRR